MSNEQKKQQAHEAQEEQQAQGSALRRLVDSLQGEGEEAEQAKALILDGLIKLRAAINSDEVKKLRQTFSGFAQWMQGTEGQRTIGDFLIWGQLYEQMRPVWPFFMEELEKDPKYSEMTFDDFMRNLDENGQPIESEFEKLMRIAQDRFESEQAAETLLEAMPRLQTANPKKHIMTTTRLPDALKDLINAGEQNLPVKNEGKKGEITNLVRITIEPQEGLTIKTDSYTEFERQVDEAVYSLFDYGDKSKAFTIPMVYRAMTSKPNESPSKNMLRRIEQYIEKGRHTDIEIDATDEVRAYMRRNGMQDADKATFYKGDRLLPLAFARITNGKETIKGYKFTADPPELAHAKATGKIMTCNSFLLDVKDESGTSIANTEGRISIKGYLLRRIQRMKRDEERKNPKISRVILLDSMMKDCAITSPDSKTEGKKYTLAALDYWQATGFIKGYNKRMKGRTLAAVEIILSETP